MTALYRHKDADAPEETYQAIQWTGDNLTGIREAVFPNRNADQSEHGRLVITWLPRQQGGRYLELMPGEWVLRYWDGQIITVSADAFAEYYQPATEEVKP
jgi:hypothetical protein